MRPFAELKEVSKSFSGVRALADVNFLCRTGSIHAILGENGAGKSTLIKIIAGVMAPDKGTLLVDGQPRRFANPAEASRAGIACVFQELSLVPDLTVAENISLARPPRWMGLVDQREERRRAEALLARIQCEDVDPRGLVRDLSLSRRQMVEIAKALSTDPKLLILDEATSALTGRDVETVYSVLGELRRSGIGMLFISHRMHEVEALCDTLSVFRNGQHVETFPSGARSQSEVIRMMIGRDISHHFPQKPPSASRRSHLEVKNLRWDSRLNGISLAVGRGEILGLGGLDGQGQKELLLALFGVLRGVTGTVSIGGRPVRPHSPADAVSKHRIALVPEDRKTEGLMLPMSVADNLLAASFGRVSTGPFLSSRKQEATIKGATDQLRIKLGRSEDPVANLSGGNQQKVVLAKWLLTEPDLVLLNDPTRGIDVGTKQEIYRLMRDLADQGKTILFYSTDYAELIGCCDRVAVIYDGRVVAELSGDAVTEEALVAAALNIAPPSPPPERTATRQRLNA